MDYQDLSAFNLLRFQSNNQEKSPLIGLQQPKSKKILVNIKVPGRVRNPSKAIELMGGPQELIKAVSEVEDKLHRGTSESHSLQGANILGVKNILKFHITPDCQVPFETKKPHQFLLKVKQQRNRRTGEVRNVIQDVKKINYEFECEALADFKYGLGDETNVEAEKELVSKYQAQLVKDLSIASKPEQQQLPSQLDQPEEDIGKTIEYMQPRAFTRGRFMYSQVKDPSINLDFLSQPLLQENKEKESSNI